MRLARPRASEPRAFRSAVSPKKCSSRLLLQAAGRCVGRPFGPFAPPTGTHGRRARKSAPRASVILKSLEKTIVERYNVGTRLQLQASRWKPLIEEDAPYAVLVWRGPLRHNLHRLCFRSRPGQMEAQRHKILLPAGPAPKSQTRVYQANADGIKVTIRTVGEDGKTTVVEHPVNYDGKEQPVIGSSQSDAIQMQRIDDHTSESVMKHADKIIGRNRRVVAEDGKTMTITYEGLDSRGREIKVTAIYDRQ